MALVQLKRVLLMGTVGAAAVAGSLKVASFGVLPKVPAQVPARIPSQGALDDGPAQGVGAPGGRPTSPDVRPSRSKLRFDVDLGSSPTSRSAPRERTGGDDDGRDGDNSGPGGGDSDSGGDEDNSGPGGGDSGED